MSELLNLTVWYLLLAGVGLVAFPISFYVFRSLSDRGYAFTRTLGLLVWAYLYWVFGNLGFLLNDLGGLLFALLGLLAVSIWAVTRLDRAELRKWFRENRKVVITVESLMLVSFLLMAFLRANNPDITGTEKPMEMAFINAILRSPSLPPLDPWLSGYSISYYHFGYIMAAMLAKLSGTPGSIAYNLTTATIFALSAVGSFGILYTLLERRSAPDRKASSNHLKALVAPFFLLIVSNLEVVLHLMHNQGWFWQQQSDGTWVSGFWSWLSIDRLNAAPPVPRIPLDQQFWWWWPASRMVQDFNLAGNNSEMIDEFPNFSFLLGDLHPHVLAIPFVMVAIGFILNYFLHQQSSKIKIWKWDLHISVETILAGGFLIGSLVFLNTWDYPFYVALFCAAYVIKRIFAGDRRWQKLTREFILLGFLTGMTSLVFYFLFFICFSSQAGGLVPNVIYVTRGIYTWIMFGPFLIPIIALLFYLWRRNPQPAALKLGIKISLGLIGGLFAFTHFLLLVVSILPLFAGVNAQASQAVTALLNSTAASSLGNLLLAGIIRRLTVPGTLLTMGVILVFGFTLVFPPKLNQEEDGDRLAVVRPYMPNYFVILLILLGTVLIVVPEFFYLLDLFGYRINTVFKFYYQTWILWSLAAAYATVILWKNLQGGWKLAFQIAVSLVVGATLFYPYFGFLERTNHFQPAKGLTLDGAAYLESSNPDEVLAMEWLKDAPLAVIAEAVGDSYTQYARFSIYTGLPTVLGWNYHEIQWRGGSTEIGSRRSDIATLYCSPRWEETQAVIDAYSIRYIVVGMLERSTYNQNSANCPNGLQETKLIENLPIAFEQGSVRIYLVP